MKHLRLSIALGLILSACQAVPALAQQAVTSYINGSGAVQSVTPSFPLPMTGTVSLGNTPIGTAQFTTTTSQGNWNSVTGFFMTQGSTAGYLAVVLSSPVTGGASITPYMCIPAAANAFVSYSFGFPKVLYSGAGVSYLDTSSCTTYTAVTPVDIGAWQ